MHLPDVGRKEAIAASCMTMTQQGDWHFWQNPNNIFETAHLRVKNAFLRGIPQAPVNMLWYRKCIHRAVSELKWNSKCVSYGSMLGSFDMITTFYISFPILPQTVTSYFRWHEVTRFLKQNQEQFQFAVNTSLKISNIIHIITKGVNSGPMSVVDCNKRYQVCSGFSSFV